MKPVHDVSRTTHTNFDVKQEKRIDDFWNIDGSRDLSNPWYFSGIGNDYHSRRVKFDSGFNVMAVYEAS